MLPLIALNSFAYLFVGTVKGYDEIYPDRLSVVNERRIYNDKLEIIEKEEVSSVKLGFVYERKNDLPKNVKVFGTWDNWANPI